MEDVVVQGTVVVSPIVTVVTDVEVRLFVSEEAS